MEQGRTTNRIQLLPEHLVDQIKAGEVVERPANVLKELLENSIDAGPTELKITIQNLGLDLIMIEDNGKGMFFDELPYAFCRHATSKIMSFEDIYKLNTFGFRGEALASISSVSRVSCHSAPTEDVDQGGKIIVHGARTIEHTPYRAQKPGTTLAVKDLFYNTPVRLKFVKSKVSEKNALKRIINAFLITNPQIKFFINFEDDEKEIYNICTDNVAGRISQIFGGGKRKTEVITSESSYVKNRVKIYISKDSTKGNLSKHQYLFVNNRLFTDKKLHQIATRNLEKFWPAMQTGHYAIELFVPEDEIDVNVHPNKTLIKFLNESDVFSLVSAAIKKLIEENKEALPSFSESSMFDDVLGKDQRGNSFDSDSSNLSLWDKIRSESFQTVNDFDNQQFSKANAREVYNLGNTNLFATNSSESLIPLGSNLFIFHTNQETYFLNGEIVLREFFLQLSNKKEVESTPLLISEPISRTKKNDEESILSKLEEIGIEIDRIDNSTLVLRSIPHEIDEIDYFNPVMNLINTLLDGKQIENCEFVDTDLSDTSMHFFLRKYSIFDLIKMGALKKIKASEIKNKFYGKK